MSQFYGTIKELLLGVGAIIRDTLEMNDVSEEETETAMNAYKDVCHQFAENCAAGEAQEDMLQQKGIDVLRVCSPMRDFVRFHEKYLRVFLPDWEEELPEALEDREGLDEAKAWYAPAEAEGPEEEQ